MHHLLLVMMVVLGVIFFFILPWPLSLILYSPIFIGGAIAYGKALSAQRLPRQTGEDAMVGKTARVVSVSRDSLEVLYGGEMWRAECTDTVRMGQDVVIQRVDGLTLHVTPAPPGSKTS